MTYYTRKCSKCGEIKPSSEFHFHNTVGKFNTQCHSCRGKQIANFKTYKSTFINKKGGCKKGKKLSPFAYL